MPIFRPNTAIQGSRIVQKDRNGAVAIATRKPANKLPAYNDGTVAFYMPLSRDLSIPIGKAADAVFARLSVGSFIQRGDGVLKKVPANVAR